MKQREFFSRGRALKMAKSTWRDPVRESPILREVEYCLSHFGFFVIPRDTRASSEAHYSIWKMIDPARFVGVVWRNNTGAARVGPRQQFVRFGVPGRPDFEGWVFASGKHIGIEVKTSTGTQTPDQKWYFNLSCETGAQCAVVRSYDDMEGVLKRWGFVRKGEARAA